MAWAVDGRLYMLFICSDLVGLLLIVIVHSFAPLGLCPSRTGGSSNAIDSVPGLCTVTPLSPGWKIVVYPSSAHLLTLASDFLSPGRTTASLPSVVSCSYGSRVLHVVLRIDPLGR